MFRWMGRSCGVTRQNARFCPRFHVFSGLGAKTGVAILIIHILYVITDFLPCPYRLLRYSSKAFLSESDSDVPNSWPQRLFPELTSEQSVVSRTVASAEG